MTLVSSGKSAKPHGCSPAPHAGPANSMVETEANGSRDGSCFDSSWDLRTGLDVAELSELPVNLAAADAATQPPTEC
ncbi:hypothetical protein [Methylibium sp.]|uniref:hypothetical protein n=1 Tax=Methylibium sp. TaxID=2067992 RepID=UPI003D151C85